MDICPASAYCSTLGANGFNGSQSPFLAAMTSGSCSSAQLSAPAMAALKWMPTSNGCNSWVNVRTCQTHDGSEPPNADYMGSLSEQVRAVPQSPK